MYYLTDYYGVALGHGIELLVRAADPRRDRLRADGVC